MKWVEGGMGGGGDQNVDKCNGPQIWGGFLLLKGEALTKTLFNMTTRGRLRAPTGVFLPMCNSEKIFLLRYLSWECLHIGNGKTSIKRSFVETVHIFRCLICHFSPDWSPSRVANNQNGDKNQSGMWSNHKLFTDFPNSCLQRVLSSIPSARTYIQIQQKTTHGGLLSEFPWELCFFALCVLLFGIIWAFVYRHADHLCLLLNSWDLFPAPPSSGAHGSLFTVTHGSAVLWTGVCFLCKQD